MIILVVKKVLKSTYIKAFLLWILWLLTGTVVYAIPNGLGWSKGFYMAVNVGYSIGWGYPLEKSYGVMWYSVLHVLIGASFVAAALGFFANNMIASSKEWYVTALDEQEVGKRDKSPLSKIRHWVRLHIKSVRIIALWLFWIGSMVLLSLVAIKDWVFIDGLYFAISSLSTGGLWAIPSDSPDWYFGVVGLFSATGIPIMALAMSSIASLFIAADDSESALKVINSKVTEIELEMMQKFEIDDGDGEISRAEYILLCAVRLGALNPNLIRVINERFNVLDADGSGALTYEELLEHPEAYLKMQAEKKEKSKVHSMVERDVIMAPIEQRIEQRKREKGALRDLEMAEEVVNEERMTSKLNSDVDTRPVEAIRSTARVLSFSNRVQPLSQGRQDDIVMLEEV